MIKSTMLIVKRKLRVTHLAPPRSWPAARSPKGVEWRREGDWLCRACESKAVALILVVEPLRGSHHIPNLFIKITSLKALFAFNLD